MDDGLDRALDSLIELGRTRGYVDVANLRKALPFDQLTETDLAFCLLRLDQAGIPVRLDRRLLGDGTPRSVNSLLKADLPSAQRTMTDKSFVSTRMAPIPPKP